MNGDGRLQRMIRGSMEASCPSEGRPHSTRIVTRWCHSDGRQPCPPVSHLLDSPASSGGAGEEPSSCKRRENGGLGRVPQPSVRTQIQDSGGNVWKANCGRPLTDCHTQTTKLPWPGRTTRCGCAGRHMPCHNILYMQIVNCQVRECKIECFS